MKARIFSVILCVMLVAFAFVYGALHGWQQDYSQVESTYASLQQQLNTRVETACNIMTVARRHLNADDSALLALKDARDVLSSAASLEKKADANEMLTLYAEQVLTALSALDTVQNDARDNMYVSTMLPQMLRESAAYTTQSAYNTAAAGFNARFEKNVISSFIARLFGMDTFEVFGAAE